MRITNTMMVNNLQKNLNNNLAGLQQLQEQLSTGKKLNRPSDDPAGLVTSLRLRTNMNENEQYLENIDEAISFIETTDSALGNANEILQRIRELTVAAANDTNDEDALKAMSTEIRQLNNQLKVVANTTYGSKYVFGGSNVTEAPCQGNTWTGNESALNVEICTGIEFPINLNMKEFFAGVKPDTEDISIPNREVITSISTDNLKPGKYGIKTDEVTLATGGTSAAAQFREIDHDLQNEAGNILAGGSISLADSTTTTNAAIQLAVKNIDNTTGDVTYSYTSNEYYIDIGGNYQHTTSAGDITVTAGTNSVQIGSLSFDIDMTGADITTLKAGDQASYNLTAAHGTDYDQISVYQDYTSAEGEPLEGGAVFSFVFPTGEINGETLDINFTTFDDQGEAYESTLSMDVGTISDADPAAAFEKVTGLFELIEELADDIESGQKDVVSDKLAAIDEKINNLLNQRAVAGARVNRLELQQSRLKSTQTSYTGLLATNEDADIAEVIMNYKMQENVYRASLSVGAQIIQPSLVDFLK